MTACVSLPPRPTDTPPPRRRGLQAGGGAKRNPCKKGNNKSKPRRGDRKSVVPSALIFFCHQYQGFYPCLCSVALSVLNYVNHYFYSPNGNIIGAQKIDCPLSQLSQLGISASGGLMFHDYFTIVNRANFRRSCFVPTLRKSTVALVFSPVPSTLTTVPTPNR